MQMVSRQQQQQYEAVSHVRCWQQLLPQPTYTGQSVFMHGCHVYP
jgi:hypothetical protein